MNYSLPVSDSKCLRRIEGLPRRVFEMPAALPVTKSGLPCRCAELKKSGCIEELWPTQVAALEEAVRARGLFAPITVGGGKTALDVLLPVVMGVKIAIALVPAGEELQLRREWEWLGQHLRVPDWGGWPERCGPADVGGSGCVLHVISYKTLSDPRYSTILLDLGPELIIADEGQKLRYLTTVTVGRVLTYFRKNPRTMFCTWSGTLTSKSIGDYAHLGAFALHEGSPFPIDPNVVADWASCLDARRGWNASPPGALERLMDPTDPFDTPRAAVHRRMIETVGVIYASKKDTDLPPLTFHERELPAAFPNEALEAAQLQLEKLWTRPDGEELLYQLEMSRCRDELQHGFYSRWDFGDADPETIRRWRHFRAQWAKTRRQFLQHRAKPGLDSPHLLEQALLKGDMPMMPEYRAWLDVEKNCTPTTGIPVWLDDSWLEDVRTWAEEHGGIVWFTHDAVGQKLAAYMPVYQEKAALVRDMPGLKKSALGLSAKACGTGTNGLQSIHDVQLLCCSFQNGAALEQLLGRLMRPGQKNAVRTHYYTRDKENLIERAREMDANYIREMMGNPQLLLTGRWL